MCSINACTWQPVVFVVPMAYPSLPQVGVEAPQMYQIPPACADGTAVPLLYRIPSASSDGTIIVEQAEDVLNEMDLGDFADTNGARPTKSALRRRRRQKAAAVRLAEVAPTRSSARLPSQTSSSSISSGVSACKHFTNESTNDDCDSTESASQSGRHMVDRSGSSGSELGSDTDRTATQLLHDLDGDDEARTRALAELKGHVREYSFHPVGCRVVQRAIAVSDRRELTSITEELHSCVVEAVDSPCANYVIQKVIELVPRALSSFVTDELAEHFAQTACHKFGCRIICRILEYEASGCDKVADAILDDVIKVCRHQFGHYVIQTMLEHGKPSQRQIIIDAMRGNVLSLARNRCGTSVVELALTYGNEEQQAAIAQELLGGDFDDESTLRLARQQFSSNILVILCTSSAESTLRHRQVMLERLRRNAVQLCQEGKYARRVLRELGLQ